MRVNRGGSAAAPALPRARPREAYWPAMSDPRPAPAPRSGLRAELVVFGLCALAVRLPFALAGPGAQLSWLPDDASYYLEAARRALEGRAWPSLDGLHATNGFQPLYMLGLIGLQALVGTDPARLLPWIVTLHLAANALAAAMLLAARPARAGASGSLAVAGALGLTAGWWGHGLAGLENAIVAPLLLALLARWHARASSDAPASARALVIDGALAALAVLARTDALAFLAVLPPAVAWRRARRIGRGPAARELAVAGLVGLAVAAPWFAACAWKFGSLSQDSARGLIARGALWFGPPLSRGWCVERALLAGFWLHRLGSFWGPMPIAAFLVASALPGPRPGAADARARAWALAGTLALAALAAFLPGHTLWTLGPARVALAAFALATPAGIAGWWTARPGRDPLGGAVMLWALLLAGVYVVVLGHFQVWYSTAPALVAVGWIALPLLRECLDRRRALAVALVAVVAAHAGVTTLRYFRSGTAEGMNAHALETGARWRTVLEARGRAEPGTRVGSFDCGELSWLAHPVPIVDLDGVMNHDAARALEARDLGALVRREHVTVVLSPPAQIARFAALGAPAVRPDPALSRALGMDACRVVEPPASLR